MVIGGSAGSLQVMMGIVPVIHPDFPVPVLIVLHRNSIFESNLEELFASRSQATVKEVEEKEPIVPGVIYIAPADYHVLIEEDQTFSLDYSERVHFSRPSIDVSFTSASDVYGAELVCLLLSGGNMDGVDGLKYVKDRGGLVVVQDPVTAEVPYMPQHAVDQVMTDFVMPAEEIPAFLKSLAFLPPA
jgi:two-component system chemotaxis response regulator CheB